MTLFYLGCYPRELLLKIKFREEISLISEDTQLCQDIKSSGFEIYKSKRLFLNIFVEIIYLSHFLNYLEPWKM